MKKGIHPDYGPLEIVLVNGDRFWTRSAKPGYLKLDIDPSTHSAWNQGKVMVSQESRVKKFVDRYSFLKASE